MLTLETKNVKFIRKAQLIHGNKYDYSQVKFLNTKTKVSIICVEHGIFLQSPEKHILGQNCPECAKIIRGYKKRNNILKTKFKNLVQPEDYKLIPLACGKKVKVDSEDFDIVKDINWCSSNDYAHNFYEGSMHRFIMNAPEGLVVDHINGDTLDNRKGNLRIVTYHQNTFNTSASKNSSSNYLGVSLDNERGKWIAQIGFNYKNIYIGRFNTEEEAGLAYNEKAKELFGEYAKLNII